MTMGTINAYNGIAVSLATFVIYGYFPLPSVYCLAWICLDVLFCTASIMHLCTISVDRYLSLRYPMKFGRNKSRRRVTLKIIFVWLLSIAMSLPLSLMYSKDHDSVLINGECQIPDPLYKFFGSIICFYIPLIVMLLTYALTVRLLADQRQNLGTTDWSSSWMGTPNSTSLERRYTWKRLLNVSRNRPQNTHSATSTDTELSTIDTHELWIQESEPSPCTMSALGQFGAEMLKLSRGLEAASDKNVYRTNQRNKLRQAFMDGEFKSFVLYPPLEESRKTKMRRASTFHEGDNGDESPVGPNRTRGTSLQSHKSCSSLDNCLKLPATEQNFLILPPPCTCPYFGDKRDKSPTPLQPEIKIVPTDQILPLGGVKTPEDMKPKKFIGSKSSADMNEESSPTNTVVTWESGNKRNNRRGSSFVSTRAIGTSQRTPLLLRRSATMRQNGHNARGLLDKSKNPSSPCLLQRYTYNNTPQGRAGTVRTHHSRTSSVISRNSSRHGRIIRLEQKATKVLGVVFFTFVILWAPFFVLNLLPVVCGECERHIENWVFQFVTWLGYASSLVNPIFYTIFNKVFRQAFKKVLMCKYKKPIWTPHR